MFKQEWIDREQLVGFVADEAFEPIGTTEDGRTTTLSDEMAAVAKMVSRADVCRIVVDPYRTRLAFSLSELTRAEKLATIAISYKRAAKKILWLNSVCRTRMGKPFVKKKLSLELMEQVEELVDEFEAAIRYASIRK